MIRRLVDWIRPPPVADLAAFRRFLSGEASYLAQRSTYEFTRNTLAWYGQAAFGDPAFNDVFRICRWEAFAGLLAGNVQIAEGALRARAEGNEAALADALANSYAAMLAEYALPAHRPNWDDAVARLRDRLGALQNAVPPAFATTTGIAREATARVIAILPARSANASEDRRTIETAFAFGAVAFQDRVRRRLQTDAVAAALLAAARARR